MHYKACEEVTRVMEENKAEKRVGLDSSGMETTSMV